MQQNMLFLQLVEEHVLFYFYHIQNVIIVITLILFYYIVMSILGVYCKHIRRSADLVYFSTFPLGFQNYAGKRDCATPGYKNKYGVGLIHINDGHAMMDK
ncbi:hypothetical protein ACJX0J_015316 [Zea mays]